ncbi:16S rRNA processing protein RimM [bacterium]|nr:16S rRNA processing protein RimM [bacterium]
MPLVRIGYVLGPFGVHGDFKCAYTTDHPEWIAGRSHYLLSDPRSGECLRLNLAQVKLRDNDFLIRFGEFDAPEAIKQYTGWELLYSARRGELPRDEPGEVYLFELAGLEVRDPEGRVLGRVSEILDSGPHYLLQLDSPGEPLFPYIEQFTREVNLAEGYLVTAYPLDPAAREEVPAEQRQHTARRRPRTSRGPSKASVKARREAGRRRP